MVDISLVVFDMAGTTVSDKREVETCFSEACKDTGLDVSDERILELQGYAKRDVFELLWKEKLGNSHELKDYVDLSYNTFCEILENHYQESEILPTEHCLGIFDLLKKNDIKIALTTGFYRKVTNIILDKLGWLDGLNDDFVKIGGKTPIDISITPTEVPAGRPKPYMIERAVDFLNISEGSRIVKIGDTPVDLEEGYNAKVWKSLAVTNGSHSHQQLSSFKNDGLLKSLADLPKILSIDVQKENRNFITF
ncbi:HAD family hydrolase [uncultured Arcticibacterium sp.]|uniref:HAD family hydrolase n=1 Tax=uncultured Arcticibacterium sp. TaxID=2173042 RepID=UPI0030F76D36